ncbi:uncharacterized protein [Rutidosis leptorrhynchoides]|uniref:uncharacterized protein n=1 Tax=Rutidosis leptorrhynchoides TaxID=125765 RepID=UPI003A994B77
MGFMGFGEKWIKLINACLTSTSISVLVNGSPTEQFFSKRGVRQGDPLSPFLFIIASEGLNYLLNLAIKRNLISGVEVGRDKVVVSHLQYADDTIIFGKWNKIEVRNTLKIFKCFEDLSRLKINLHRGCAYGIGTIKEELSLLASWFGCKEGSFPFNYLGLPIGENLRSQKSWKPVYDKFKNRLSDWKAKSISFGGRLTLIKSVLNSLPLYYFSLFKVPLSVIKELEGQGKETSFWDESWCGEECFHTAFPRLFRLELNKTATVANRIGWAEGSAVFKWEWACEPKWRASSELSKLCDIISSYTTSGKSNDAWTWKYENNGIYTTKSLTSILHGLAVASRVTPEPTILNKLVPQKIDIFIWRAAKNKLPVRSELDKRGIDLHSTKCPVCDEDIETLHHTLISCKIAREVWDLIRRWWKLDRLLINNTSDLAKALNPKFINPLYASFWQAIVWVTCYFPLKNRNDHVFRNNPLCPSKIVSDIQSKSFEWINCRGKKVRLECLSWFTDPLASIINAKSNEEIG